MSIFIAIPIPRTLGKAKIIHDTHPRHVFSENTTMVEPAPNRLSASPFTAFPTFVPAQIAPTGHIFAGPPGGRTAVLRHHAGNAGLLEVCDVRSVTIISGHIPNPVYTVFSQRPLGPSHGGLARRSSR